MDGQQSDDETGTIFDISKQQLPWHLGIFVLLLIPAIIIAVLTTTDTSFFDFIFSVFDKVANFAATYVAVSAGVFFMSVVKKYLAKRDEKREREGYERAAQIAADRGVKLPPYKNDRDGKGDNNRKPSE